MNLTLIIGLLMFAVMIALLATKKLSFGYVAIIVPVAAGLLLGYKPNEIGTMAVDQMTTLFKAIGMLVFFAMLFIQTMNSAGLFKKITLSIMGVLGEKDSQKNICLLMAITCIVTIVATLSGNVSVRYLIIFPTLLPLYDQYKLDRRIMFTLTIIAGTVLYFIPWGGVTYPAAYTGEDVMVLSKAVFPVCMLYLASLPFVIFYFSRKQKRMLADGTYGQGNLSGVQRVEVAGEDPMERPKLFWFNLLLFASTIVAITVFKVSGALAFLLAFVIAVIVNYPDAKDKMTIIQNTAKVYVNVLFMIMAVGVLLGIFNGSGMKDAIAGAVVSIVPSFLAKYINLVFGLAAVFVMCYLPYEVYMSMYPLLITLGGTVGLTAIQVLLPIVNPVALSTATSPLNPSTHVGTGASEIEVSAHTKFATPVCAVVVLGVTIAGMLLGFFKI